MLNSDLRLSLSSTIKSPKVVTTTVISPRDEFQKSFKESKQIQTAHSPNL